LRLVVGLALPFRPCRKPKPVGFDERVAVPIIDWGHGVPVVCMATPVLLREVQMPNESVITNWLRSRGVVARVLFGSIPDAVVVALRAAFLVGNVEASVDLAPVITAVPRAAVGKVTFVRILLANWGQRGAIVWDPFTIARVPVV